jgi:hypothetical protein
VEGKEWNGILEGFQRAGLMVVDERVWKMRTGVKSVDDEKRKEKLCW